MLTWSDNGNWVKMDAANDRIRGRQAVRDAVWYATGATAGTTLLLLTETKSGTPIAPAVAEAAQLVKAILMPEGYVEGITLTTLGAGHVVVYFKDRLGYHPKKIHDETPEAGG